MLIESTSDETSTQTAVYRVKTQVSSRHREEQIFSLHYEGLLWRLPREVFGSFDKTHQLLQDERALQKVKTLSALRLFELSEMTLNLHRYSQLF